MKALSLEVGTSRLDLVERPEPAVTAPDEVKLRVLEVGICGTDREEAAGGRALAPDGDKRLVIGHEMLGVVVETGASVSRVKPGDHAVFTVRRGCGRCPPCAMGRSDMCRTGGYVERGIWGRDGYQAEYVVDKEQYVVRVPEELREVGVLAEPLSVAEKALDEAVRVQRARLPVAAAEPDWLSGRRCLVAGLGPVGLLAALALRLRGAEVLGLDVVDPGGARPRWLERIGGAYVDGRRVKARDLGRDGPIELIVEAAGVAPLEFDLIEALGRDGVYALTGIPPGDRPMRLDGAGLVRRLVLQNQALVGSVNAARGHFQLAIDDLARASLRWAGHAGRLITARLRATEFRTALFRREPEEIKTVLRWPP